MITIADVNAMSAAAFTSAFADVAEHSPWVAEAAAAARPFASRHAIVAAFETAMRTSSRDNCLALIRAHPDLAGKAKLTSDSASEQKGAGLDTLTESEFTQFTSLNEAYKQRFGFPFIFAVKGATKHQILESFKERLHNDAGQEFETAMTQIARIFRFRIEERVAL